jgi:hypothetical protein
MNVARIYHIIRSDPYTASAFSGIGYPDLQLEIHNLPSLFFLNTDLSDNPGEHWCVAYFVNKKRCEFFDPYAARPEVYDLKAVIDPHCSEILYNTKRVQGYLEKTCGHHCIYFSLLRCRGHSFEKILTHFYSNDTDENDKRVFKSLQKYGTVMSHIQDV